MPQPEPNRQLLRGWQAYQSGNITEALEAYTAALETSPSDASLWYDAGCLYALNEEPDRAEVALRQAIALDPTLAQAHDALGQVLESQGNLPKALESYASAAALAPGRTPYLRRLARIHLQLKQFGAAHEALGRLLIVEPKDAASRYILGVIELKDDQPDLALNNFTRALEATPNDLATLNGLALAAMRIKDFEQAAHALEQAQAANPKDARTQSNLGLLAAARKDWAQARAAWRHALELQPGLEPATQNLSALDAAVPSPSEEPDASSRR